MMRTMLMAGASALLFCGCGATQTAEDDTSASAAPGAPGEPSVWAYSGKTGIGTSYEAYGNEGGASPTGPVSKVWFSLADGFVTETMAGLIHQAQIKDVKLALVGDGFVDVEGEDATFETAYLDTDEAGRPLSLAYRLTTTDTDGQYEVLKDVFTDPARQTLFMRVTVRATGDAEITPYLLVNPHVANTGDDDSAAAGQDALYASDGDAALAVVPSTPFEAASAGFVGASDGLTQLRQTGSLSAAYESTGAATGNVAMTGQLARLQPGDEVTVDLAIGFGPSRDAAAAEARGTLADGYDAVLAAYNGEGEAAGWEDYLASLGALPRLAAEARDGGALAYASAMVLKAQEDKTHPGALIASLSNPWGDTVSAAESSTGYKAVWPRDFYQVAMAFLALGDEETARAAFDYLPDIQVTDDMPGNEGASGWFLQKTHVDGEREWVMVQLDQTAMPIMLGWKLWQAGVLSDEELTAAYDGTLRPAAVFLTEGGETSLDYNQGEVTPPRTQQERWEEQPGYSPSTTAAVVAGLVSAADIARALGRPEDAARFLASADDYEARIEDLMFTTEGAYGDGRYFLRITQNEDPNDNGATNGANGQAGVAEDRMLDAGFLELVRYGVRPADAPSITQSLPELDDQTIEDHYRVKYDFTFEGESGPFPGWRRYGNDGYGEDVDTGANYGDMTPGQRGRVWPFFTGERGHYELAAGRPKQDVAQTYVRAMELFANQGLMLPEQVWDGVGADTPHGYETGEGTNSATPLAWTHAEYVKLLRSLSDGEVWDRYAPVEERYAND
ncbi:glucan 1,4-alpha-glucosidase [Parvularcula dongshanensis]|uniref:Glucoamylase n=1 Tax=Parvularcula dongshanensis TaxID=1173995 RepID=A0A840I784_9PROT|nr:glucan 1,4-alpha-glucosidase [Parvularcula dongshanensis]MBB4660185.1 glucoamylase [Parvularcula dongshanensis]